MESKVGHECRAGGRRQVLDNTGILDPSHDTAMLNYDPFTLPGRPRSEDCVGKASRRRRRVADSKAKAIDLTSVEGVTDPHHLNTREFKG